MPVGDAVAAAEAGERAALFDHDVVDAVVAGYRRHDAVGADVLDVDGPLTLEAHRLFADVFPGRRADRGVAVNQLHVLGETRVEALVHEVADAVDVSLGVVAELRDRIVVVVEIGGDVDVAVTQTGGPVAVLPHQAVPSLSHIGHAAAFSAFVAAAEEAVDRHRGQHPQRGGHQGDELRVGLVDARPLDQAAGSAPAAFHAADRRGVRRPVEGVLDTVADRVDGVAEHAALGVAADGVLDSPVIARGVLDELLALVDQVVDADVHARGRVTVDDLLALVLHELLHVRIVGRVLEELVELGVRQDEAGDDGFLVQRGEQLAAGCRGVGILAVLESDRVRRAQSLVGVDVVDRLDGRGVVVPRRADGVVLWLRVVGQLGGVIAVHRCPRQVGFTFSR